MTGEAIKAFMSATCPFCGGEKLRIKVGFFESCLGRLSPNLRAAMIDESQFLNNFHSAADSLKALK
jgi:hypothetical protein